MIEPIVHQGNFWATDDPQAQANGELIVDLDGRVTLKTDGSFRDPNDDQYDGFVRDPASRNGTHLIEGQTISENIKLEGNGRWFRDGDLLGPTPTIAYAE